MKVYDPKRKKHVRKIKLYNVGPLTTVENLNEIETGLDVFMALKKDFKDKWFLFLKNYVQRCNFLPFDFEDQLNFLILVCNENSRIELLKKLRSISEYDPNTDPIPYDKLPHNLLKYIKTKQNYLSIIKKDIKENLFVEKNIIGIYTELTYSKELVELYDYLKIDIIIFSNNNELKIKFNQFDKKFYEIQGKDIDIKNIFEVLYDYGGKPQKENDFYTMSNTIEKGELIELIKNNISKND